MNEKQLISEAINEVKVADHMLTMTYPLIRDPKMLIAILQKLLNASNKALDTAIRLEYEWKRINAIPQNFNAKIDILRKGFIKEYNFTNQEIKTVKDIYRIILEHKNASIEFSRHEKFIISDNDYRLRTISVDQIKRYIPLVKSFIEKIYKRVENHESWKNKTLYR